ERQKFCKLQNSYGLLVEVVDASVRLRQLQQLAINAGLRLCGTNHFLRLNFSKLLDNPGQSDDADSVKAVGRNYDATRASLNEEELKNRRLQVGRKGKDKACWGRVWSSPRASLGHRNEGAEQCLLQVMAPAVGFLAVSSVITMSAPFFLGKVIDVIYTNPSEDFTDSLTSLCALLSGVFLCGAAANATRVYLMQTAGQRIVKRLRTTMFSSILKQETAFFDKTRTGELINRLSSDTALLGRSVTENLSDGLRAGAQASVGVGMMFFVSPSLATFVLSVVPPLAVLAVIYGRYLRKLTKVTQDSLAEATQLAEERIGNIRTVRAFGQEMAEVEKYTNKVDYVLQLAKKEALARAGFFGATGLSGNLIVLSVLYKGGLLMGSAYMTVGELSSFLMYAFWVGISIG
ncbi:PREDICTED: ATP-binding cassette sub-family B member 10, mitochondrial-like, partial [Cariama cristata]|uniref:ATP-binding cassette sub-family B member 10, mitochondrial-like n=1 Tax=Cariama cristata TaxID=54380 RepID=UPI00052024C5